MNIARLSLIAWITVAACADNGDEIQSHLTINVGPDYTPRSEFDTGYFFISDDLGNVLDVKPIEAGKELKLVTSKLLNRVNLTLCRLSKSPSQESHVLSTFLSLPTNSEPINFKATDFQFSNPIGSAKITVTNFSGSASSVVISNGQDWYLNRNEHATSMVADGSQLVTEIKLFENNSEIIICSLKGSEPVYRRLTGVKPGENISVDHNDFLTYSNRIGLNLTTPSSSSIMGFKQGNLKRGHWVFSRSNALSLPFLGYLDGFDNYLTNLSFGIPNGSVIYSKLGSLPTSIDLTAPTLNISSKDINNFEFKYSHGYSYRVSIWRYGDLTDPNQNTFDWFVRGDQPDQKVNLPEEFLTKYNFLQVDKLEYSQSRFVRCTGCSYNSFVKEFFSGEKDKFERYEYFFR